jgi:hypothetical protein
MAMRDLVGSIGIYDEPMIRGRSDQDEWPRGLAA